MRVNRRSFLKQGAVSALAPSLLSSARLAGAGSVDYAGTEWRCYGGDPGGKRYSVLDQINRSNVHQLRVAWVYHTGDARQRPRTTIECTPLVVNGVVYITSALVTARALDATNGRLLWAFDPWSKGSQYRDRETEAIHGVSRGVAYWEDGRDKRIFFTAAARLYCLDATTGQPIATFGNRGSIDLTKGLGRDTSGLSYDVTSPGSIYKNLLILGSEVGEGPEPAAPGHVRAFDVHTGKTVWIFHTIPCPGEFGHETWVGNQWKTVGGANDWGGMTLDEKRGWLFLATGSCAFDFYGAERLGPNLFGNCVIALDALTGRRIWHYQLVHHDLWDRDACCPPNLVTVRRSGQSIDAVAEPTKFGQLFLFDRETGKPLIPVEQGAVPASDVPGEKAWPTQPRSLAYTRQLFTEEDVTNVSPKAHAYALEIFKKIRTGNEWLPPSFQGSLVFPGFDGGTNWGGASVDPHTGWFYVNSHDEPWILTLVHAPTDAGYRYGITGYKRFVDPDGYAAINPPWGQLTALDLNRGKIVWQVVLGEHKELTARGIKPTGTQNIGGSVVTAGGLVFIGSTQDEKFRAFDKTNGKILWEAQLPAGGYASPCTYETRGKQYVVIAAGGGGKPRTKAGDAFVAFALP